MTLEEFKVKVYTLIEEYNEDSDDLTDDEDLAAKFNSVTNQVMNEICRFKKIPDMTTIDVKFVNGQTEHEITMTDIDEDIYQIDVIRGVESIGIGKQVIFNKEGTAKIYYFKYPKQIDTETDDNYEFELDREVLECMVYGVAADLLKSDVSANYGKIYAERYEQLLQRLDSRNALGGIYIDGGVEV